MEDFKREEQKKRKIEEDDTNKNNNNNVDDNYFDKVYGLLVGNGLGNALAIPHAIRLGKTLEYTGELKYKQKYFNSFKNIHRYSEIGQISAQTEMMITLARSLVRNKKYLKEDVIESYMKWANSTNASIHMGKDISYLFKGIEKLEIYNRRWQKKFSQTSKVSCNQSSLPLTRSPILALLNNENYVKDDCEITHPDIICIEANKIYFNAIYYCFYGRDKKEILENAQKHANRKEIKTCLNHVERKENRIVKENKEWCLHALYCAFYALYWYDDFRSGIDAIIKMGGEIENNASIAGALLGAYYGFKRISKDPITKNNIEILTECDTSKGDIKRHKQYEMRDIKELARTLTEVFKRGKIY